ncbi:MAG: hypothetical protein BWY52_01024 [Chloroflexi bacterium ADurb.Bin325]|nr:MAG: hypothetical protein BWY52_01024 [Chloroflexi bacterium ADurb.Bin325]
MSADAEEIRSQSLQLLDTWLSFCVRRNRLSRNTIAIGIVVLDHLRQKCPVSREDVISAGGEIKGSRAALSTILKRYGISERYLKEATTRQAHQDGQRLLDMLEWGGRLCTLSPEYRDALLVALIDPLVKNAKEWLNRQSLKLEIDRSLSPAAWIHLILENAKGQSGGIVEQHLVGAKLARRYPQTTISNHPAHAADVQTDRSGDFEVQRTIYHVTGAPGQRVIEKCLSNARAGYHPILLIPRSKQNQAVVLAQVQNGEDSITIISIEDFVALNIIEMATGEQRDFYSVLKDIVSTYNQRLSEVETDMSLQIEVR